jgi:hypothetical protein
VKLWGLRLTFQVSLVRSVGECDESRHSHSCAGISRVPGADIDHVLEEPLRPFETTRELLTGV